jgi:thiol-disulfide isomerase/thioredoxin
MLETGLDGEAGAANPIVRLIPLSALVSLFLLIAACGGGAQASACGLSASIVDKPLPVWTGSTTSGEDLDLAEYGDGTVVLNVWGSWCGPCRAEAPELIDAADRFAGSARFLGVDVQDSEANAQAFEREFAIPYPSAFDPSSELAGNLTDAISPPVTLVAVDGRIRGQILGSTTADQIACVIEESGGKT